MTLDLLPRDQLKLGIRVWNHAHTQRGIVTEILPEDREDISIRIKWDDGKESRLWHFWCSNIEIAE